MYIFSLCLISNGWGLTIYTNNSLFYSREFIQATNCIIIKHQKDRQKFVQWFSNLVQNDIAKVLSYPTHYFTKCENVLFL